MSRYLCIHGHYYQPPRENPWLEAVEPEDSAAPFHDWNERIAEECYAPNAAARILDDSDRITRIVNNYARTSFNIGPTLMAWLESHRPETYAAILAADRESRQHFSGHGSALAQAYNHLIMPLANRRDRQTQVLWGVRDFSHRFGREPEGMWLPETAVDLATLEALADAGIRFTILAPSQARHIRRLGEKSWQPPGRQATNGPCLCRLPSGRDMVVFFYYGSIARDIAFGNLLDSGERLVRRIRNAYTSADTPQLLHFATDGETYGHHHRFGEMALAWCLQDIEKQDRISLTIYGEYLEKHPPEFEVEIREMSSWSCAHGVERWRSDCGCRINGSRGWRQAWRKPLRESLDWLGDRLAGHFEAAGRDIFGDPWAARDDYIEVILDRSRENVAQFLERHLQTKKVDADKRTMALKLLEMQRQAMAMFTSCGWFFDDVAGIESRQVLRFAARALQLAGDTGADDFTGEFLQKLQPALSNDPAKGDAARIFREEILPRQVGLGQVAAHHAIVAGFNREAHPAAEPVRLYSYHVRERKLEQHAVEGARLYLGHLDIESDLTGEMQSFDFAMLHIGGYSLNAGILPYRGDEHYADLRNEALDAFRSGDYGEVLHLLDSRYGESSYNLWNLFADERRHLIERLLAETLEDIEAEFRTIHDRHYNLLRFLHDADVPIPPQLAMPVGTITNTRLSRAIRSSPPDFDTIRAMTDEILYLKIKPDRARLGHIASGELVRLVQEAARQAPDNTSCRHAIRLLEVLEPLEPQLDLWRAQTRFWKLFREISPEKRPVDTGRLAARLRVNLEAADGKK